MSVVCVRRERAEEGEGGCKERGGERGGEREKERERGESSGKGGERGSEKGREREREREKERPRAAHVRKCTHSGMNVETGEAHLLCRMCSTAGEEEEEVRVVQP